MIGRAAIVVIGFGLSACATGSGPVRDMSDPGVVALSQLPVPQYFATVAVATQVARNCARYRFDAELESLVNQTRNAADRGSLAAATQRAAIEVETDVMQRSFIARHQVDFAGGDLCAAADAELLSASALGALLAPV
ncbi:hypothetical protein [Yoonia sp.]|uniref:hypothetical protein n=1 Tax=Yoonia sp. TaxID=2212373 RepID=UPI003A4DE2D0